MSALVAATDTPPRKHPTARLAALTVTYVALGLLGLGVASVAVWFGDPCGPFAASSEGSAYDEFSSGVMGGFGLLYLAGGIPAAIWHRRAVAWVIVVLAFLAATIGAVAVVATAAPGGTFCDLGGGY